MEKKRSQIYFMEDHTRNTSIYQCLKHVITFFIHPEIKKLVDCNVSFDTSGTVRKGEDWDFKLETVNENVKHG